MKTWKSADNLDDLIAKINAAFAATVKAMKRGNESLNSKSEDAAWSRLFSYVVGRKPTEDELNKMLNI